MDECQINLLQYLRSKTQVDVDSFDPDGMKLLPASSFFLVECHMLIPLLALVSAEVPGCVDGTSNPVCTLCFKNGR
jgi:hypothetical protein